CRSLLLKAQTRQTIGVKMLYKKQRFMEVWAEEIHLVRMLKIVKKEREGLIKEDIVRYKGKNKLLNLWKTLQK
ncbi:hypothetical protein KAT51_00555, partial [bacterium]|nr:hypothetical protein [bacterium]